LTFSAGKTNLNGEEIGGKGRGIPMAQKAIFHLDVLIKKEKDYYSAHCLQFDLVATDDTLKKVQKAIRDLCVSHIENSIANDNMEYLFSPAPKEVWAEYFTRLEAAGCQIKHETLPSPVKTHPSFSIQEVACHA
jgi:hypothetical protein